MIKQFFNNSVKRISSLSPQAAIAGALIIVVVISGLALLLTRGSSEAKANPALQPNAARLDRVEGTVGIARPQNGVEVADESANWTEAVVNTPVTVGDRIYARDYAHASIALSAQNYVRLNPATSPPHRRPRRTSSSPIPLKRSTSWNSRRRRRKPCRRRTGDTSPRAWTTMRR